MPCSSSPLLVVGFEIVGGELVSAAGIGQLPGFVQGIRQPSPVPVFFVEFPAGDRGTQLIVDGIAARKGLGRHHLPQSLFAVGQVFFGFLDGIVPHLAGPVVLANVFAGVGHFLFGINRAPGLAAFPLGGLGANREVVNGKQKQEQTKEDEEIFHSKKLLLSISNFSLTKIAKSPSHCKSIECRKIRWRLSTISSFSGLSPSLIMGMA